MNHLTRIDEDEDERVDEMADFSYVERCVRKVHAFKFRGYWDEVPQFFKLGLTYEGYDNSRRIDIITYWDESKNGRAEIEHGNFIVIDGNKTKVYSRNQFTHLYRTVSEFAKYE